MANLSSPARNSVEAQRDMFRLAKAREQLSTRVLAQSTNIPKSTLDGWAGGAAMPAWALGALAEAGVPDHLLSLVLEPFGRCVLTPADDGLGELAREAAHFTAEQLDAQADGAINPREREALRERARRVAGAALRVVNDDTS